MVKSIRRAGLWVGLVFLGLSSPAFAQDDDFLGDDDEIDIDLGDDTPPEKPKTDEPETEGPKTDEDPVDPDAIPDLPSDLEEPDDTTIDFQDSLEGDEFDLLGDEPDANTPEGGDTAAAYRMTLEQGRKLDTDEELQLWDAYLEKYPNTSFKAQIDTRRKELEASLYQIGTTKPTDTIDAEDAAFSFAHGLLIENINPRDRFLAQLEWGLPTYASISLDIEKELAPRFSVHGGFRRRFTGPSVEGGLRYALVRSPRTHTLVTGMVDVRFNTGPAFIAVRPMLAAGKRFGNVDIQAQAGLEIAPRDNLDVRVIGGINATYRASDAIGLFAETALYMHTLSGKSGPYRFNQFAFGMSFLPAQQRENPEDVEITVATTLPYSSAYWQYHFGSIVGQLVLAF